MSAAPRYIAIVAAGGRGTRTQHDTPKQYRRMCGVTVLERTLRQLLCVSRVSAVVVGADGDADAILRQVAAGDDGKRPILRAEAGRSRAETVNNALRLASRHAAAGDWTLVHDAARPLVDPADIDRLIDRVGDRADGGLLAWPVADSLAKSADGRYERSVSRDDLWRAATPQMFRLGDLRSTLDAAIARGDGGTDEASQMRAAGLRPVLVACSPSNFKITTAEDFAMAERHVTPSLDPRIGTGFDVHALVPDRPLVLGGVTIPFAFGLAGHSDADVLLHAVADACLGAAGLGDLGRHFPDTDPSYRGADSRMLLRRVCELVGATGSRVHNIDATVIAEAPRLAPHIDAMRANIADDCAIDVAYVNVKATTTEGLGYCGRGEGIAAQASVIIM